MMGALVLIQKWRDKQDCDEAYAEAEAAQIGLLREGEQNVAGSGVKVTRGSTRAQRRKDAKKFRAALKLAQKNKDMQALLALDPDDEEFKYTTKTSEKVDVEIFVSREEEF